MTRIAALVLVTLAVVVAGCGGSKSAGSTGTAAATVTTTRTSTTAKGSVAFDLRFRRIRQQLILGLKQIASGKATGVAIGAGTVLTKCTDTVTAQLGARAKSASQQRQVSQLRTACADVANAIAKLKKGNTAAAASLAKTALTQLQQASK